MDELSSSRQVATSSGHLDVSQLMNPVDQSMYQLAKKRNPEDDVPQSSKNPRMR